jgi:thiol-disulfide isomerase/thioredoxin
MRGLTTPLAVVLALTCLLGPRSASAQVVQITAQQAALRVRYEKGARVVLFYSYSCPYSRQEFPAFLSLARQYTPVGVTFLAFSLDDDPEVLDAYLGRDLLPFDRQLIVAEGPGSTARAFAAEGIRVPPKASTPSMVVFGPDGQRVGQVIGTGGVRQTDRWLRRLGFTPE